MGGEPEFLVTALVSTYRAERFLRGRLEDLLAQTLADRLEIIVVDSDSPQEEGRIAREFMERHPTIHYLRTGERENSHLSYNRAIRLARGRYLTTANTDDRLRPDALERMVQVLERHPEFSLVYADSLLTDRENETFAGTGATRRWDWPDFTLAMALATCPFGPQPLWRRAVHDRVGLFDPHLWVAGDQDMFLRIAAAGGAVHLRETLGLFLQREDSNSGAGRRPEVTDDVMRVLRRHREGLPPERIFPALADTPDRERARAAAWFELGNLCALSPYNDFTMAFAFYEKALGCTSPRGWPRAEVEAAYANNAACLFACLGLTGKALEAFRLAGALPEAAANRALARRGEEGSFLPRHFRFRELPHPVVAASRRTRGLEIDGDGGVRFTAEHEQVPWDVYGGTNGVAVTAGELAAAKAGLPRRAAPAPGKIPTRPAWDPPGRRLHVCLVMYGWADSGGGTILPRQVARGLVRRGHRVSVFYAAAAHRPARPDYTLERETEEGVELHALCNRPSLFLDTGAPERELDDGEARRLFRRFLARTRPDLVHFYNLHNLGMSLAAEAKAAGLPTLYSSNNYWPLCPRLYLFMPDLELCTGPSPDGEKCARCLQRPDLAPGYAARYAGGLELLNRHIDRHLAVSHRVREIFIGCGADPERVEVVQQQPASLDHNWRLLGSRRRPAARLDRPLQVGFIGSLLPHKGVQVLVDALQLLPTGKVQAHLHGDVRPDFAAALAARDRRGAVTFGGPYDLAELPARLAGIDLVVVPSLWEDCAPFVVAESLAAGLPVLGSRLGGIPDFITEGENGLLFTAGDAADLARSLARFLEDPTLLGRMQGAIVPPRGFQAYLEDLLERYRGSGGKGPRARPRQEPVRIPLPAGS